MKSLYFIIFSILIKFDISNYNDINYSSTISLRKVIYL